MSAPLKLTQLESARDLAADQDVRRAVRTLLQNPILTTDGPFREEFSLVRRHEQTIRTWLENYTGWTLHVTSELARLRKLPGDLTDSTFPAADSKTRVPFSKRRYVLLCLALAALQKCERQTTLTSLATAIIDFIASEPRFAANGTVFDLGDQAQRRDLVAVIRVIIEMQVIRNVHGDEELYVRDSNNNVLYAVNRPVLISILCVQRGPSTVTAVGFRERISAICTGLIPDTKEAANRQIRWMLYRRLLEQPVLYYADLTEAEREYLKSQRSQILRSIEQITGLKAEIRKEGIAMLDETGELTDKAFSEEGTEGHLTMLLAEFIAGTARQFPGELVGISTLESKTNELIGEYRKRWKRDVTEVGAVEQFTEIAIHRLEALRLVRRTPDGVLPLPAIARYEVAALSAEISSSALF